VTRSGARPDAPSVWSVWSVDNPFRSRIRKTLTSGALYVPFLFMSGPDGTIERSDLILDELATLGLTLARDLHNRAVEAKDNDQAARLAMAFHHISRSVRQSLALQARLQRDRRRQAGEAEDQAERRAAAPVQARKAQVRAAVQRLVWTERPDWNLFSTRQKLDLILDAEAEDDGFLEIPLEAHIARIASALKLPPRAEPPPEPGENLPVLRRSSA